MIVQNKLIRAYLNVFIIYPLLFFFLSLAINILTSRNVALMHEIEFSYVGVWHGCRICNFFFVSFCFVLISVIGDQFLKLELICFMA